MEIALIIVGGLVLMVTSASFFDFLTKRRGALKPQIEGRIAALEQRVGSAELKLAERDEKIAQLESELGFVNKLIEDKGQPGGSTR